MRIYGICGLCDKFPGMEDREEGCPVQKHEDGKWHLSDFQLTAECEQYKKKGGKTSGEGQG